MKMTGLALLANEIGKVELPKETASHRHSNNPHSPTSPESKRSPAKSVTPQSPSRRGKVKNVDIGDSESVATTLTEAERIKAIESRIINNKKMQSEAKAKKMASSTANTVAAEGTIPPPSSTFWKAPGSRNGTVLGNKELKSLVSVNNKSDRTSADDAVKRMNSALDNIKKSAAMQEIKKEQVVRAHDDKDRSKAEKTLKKLEEKAAKKRAEKEAAEKKNAQKLAKRGSKTTPQKNHISVGTPADLETKSIKSASSPKSNKSKTSGKMVSVSMAVVLHFSLYSTNLCTSTTRRNAT